jgi:heat shock protein HtpX
VYTAIARNKRNTWLIMIAFVLIIGGLGLLAGWLAANDWWITAFVVLGAVGYATLQYFVADREALALAGAVEIQKADNPRLWNMVENLCIATGTPMPKVHVVQDAAPNAFATGRTPERAAIAVTTGLLDIMDDQELEGVLAHELGHVRNYDIRVSLIVFGLVVAIGLLADVFLRLTLFGGGRRGGNGQGQIVFLIFGIVAAVIAPLLAGAVQAAISRQREYLADATAALTTRNPDGLASALAKLQAHAQPLKKANTSMAHLWMADPLRPNALARLFSTHPPIPDRIERLTTMGGSF